jgi:hypothetical protein
MAFFRPALRCAILTLACIGGAHVTAATIDRAFAQSQDALPPDIAANAKTFKEADARYVKALCDDGLKKERAPAKSARDLSQDALAKAISNSIDQSSDVQKALDIATAAGGEASKAATSPDASAQDKAAANSKFEKAKQALREAVAHENARVEARVKGDFGVTFVARDGCPDDKSTSNGKKAKRKVAHEKNTRHRANERESGSSGNVPVGGSISFGGGGMGMSIGR